MATRKKSVRTVKAKARSLVEVATSKVKALEADVERSARQTLAKVKETLGKATGGGGRKKSAVKKRKSPDKRKAAGKTESVRPQRGRPRKVTRAKQAPARKTRSSVVKPPQ